MKTILLEYLKSTAIALLIIAECVVLFFCRKPDPDDKDAGVETTYGEGEE